MSIHHEFGPSVTQRECHIVRTPTEGDPTDLKWDVDARYLHSKSDAGETPDFYRRRKRGDLLPFQYWQKVVRRGVNLPGSYYAVTDGGTVDQSVSYYYNHDDWIPPVIPPSDILGNIDVGPLVTGAASKIYSSGFDALTFLAELKDIRRLFLGTGWKALQQCKKVRDLHSKATLTSVAKAAAGDWLKWRFGVRPLIAEMQEVNYLINHANTAKERFIERVGTGTALFDSYTRDVNHTPGVCTVSVKMQYDLSVRGSVGADISPPTWSFNPITTLWELTPYSFVLDWIINVGSWLQSMSLLTFAHKHVASGGYALTLTIDTQVTTKSVNSGYSSFVCVGGGSGTGVYYGRNPTSVPYNPSLNVNLDMSKVVDLVALARQFRK